MLSNNQSINQINNLIFFFTSANSVYALMLFIFLRQKLQWRHKFCVSFTPIITHFIIKVINDIGGVVGNMLTSSAIGLGL